MKSQDIVVLLKIVSLHRALAARETVEQSAALPTDWEGWEVAAEKMPLPEHDPHAPFSERFTTRGLESSLGLSKSEISKAIQRSIEVGLAMKERKTGYPKANTAALLDFIVYGLKYVFPAKPGPLVRGIPTAAAAPVLLGKLASPGSYIQVWPDPWGKVLGQHIEPLYKSVPHAVKRDADLYAMLALVDAIRLGKPREATLARQLLEPLMTI